MVGPDTPLLDGQEASLADQQAQHDTFQLPQPPRLRPSMDSIGGDSSEAEELLAASDSPQPDAIRGRGPAPPYMESLSIDSGVAFNESTEDGHASPQAPAIPRVARRSSSGRRPLFGRSESASVLDPHNGRLSHLLHIFHPGNGQRQAAISEPTAAPPPVPDRPPTERPAQRRRARGATVAGMPTPSPTSPYLNRTHRPSTSSTSASALSAMFRTRSNTSMSPAATRDRLASPSMISLHSISAPLTHTVVRTEYTYPRTGPTPEQMKFLASVDSFQRFGVPYGPDALAYAASVSRVDLSQPPPVFEEVAGDGSDGEGAVDGENAQSGSGPESSSPTSSQQGSPNPSADPSEAQPQVVETAIETGAPGATPAGQVQEPSQSESQTPADQSQPAPSLALEPPQIPESSAPLTAEDVKKILKSLGPPPSSFKPKTPLSPLSTVMRPGSRASSHQTFATAEEFSGPGSPDTITMETPTKPAIVITAEDKLAPDAGTVKENISHIPDASEDPAQGASTLMNISKESRRGAVAEADNVEQSYQEELPLVDGEDDSGKHLTAVDAVTDAPSVITSKALAVLDAGADTLRVDLQQVNDENTTILMTIPPSAEVPPV